MRVPSYLTVQLVGIAPVDLSGVIIQIAVSTGQRNPRHIYLPKTDRSGCASLTREDFLGQFTDYTYGDLMGSWGTIHDALPSVEVSLYDSALAVATQQQLSWPLGEHEKEKWPSREAEVAYRT